MMVEELNRGQHLVRQVRSEAMRLLNYWHRDVLRDDGSFYGVVDARGRIQEDAPLSLILATRLLWTFSRAMNSGLVASDQYQKEVDGLYRYLVDTFFDPESLGFYWMVDVNGVAIYPHKHIYGQAFSVYALAEYYAASGHLEALRYAQLTYEVIEAVAADPRHGGYLESFNQAFEFDASSRLSSINRGAAKTMNTHLHLLEAFTRLFQIWPNPTLKARLTDLLDLMVNKVVDPVTFHFHGFFDQQWRPQSREASYGHDIEGSWLMVEAAHALKDTARLKAVQALCLNMVEAVWNEGADEMHGLMNEGIEGRITDDGFDWWPQAEALVGLINAYQVSGKAQYLERAYGVWEFIDGYVINRQQGEWHARLGKDHQPKESNLVDAWKCPYHNTRACLEVMQRLGSKPGPGGAVDE